MVSLVDNHFYGLAELLCLCIIKNGPENSLGLRARNISGDVTHVGSDAGSTISITLELVEFELLCAYMHPHCHGLTFKMLTTPLCSVKKDEARAHKFNLNCIVPMVIT